MKKRAKGITSGITGLQVMIFGTMNGGFWGLLVVGWGIPSRQYQGGDQDDNGTGLKKSLHIGLYWVFHNQLIVRVRCASPKNWIKITLKSH
jgi:hypothetical protein